VPDVIAHLSQLEYLRIRELPNGHNRISALLLIEDGKYLFVDFRGSGLAKLQYHPQNFQCQLLDEAGELLARAFDELVDALYNQLEAGRVSVHN
jgi:hypothetical protein